MPRTQSRPKDITKCVGYLRYEGQLVEDGIIDAHAAAKALSGFDSALRFFITQERPDLLEARLPIPVRIEKGSWVIEIPQDVGTILTAGVGWVSVKYLAKAAEKMAENDFSSTGIKDIFRRGLEGVVNLIRVARHLGHTNLKRSSMRFDRQGMVGFVNEGQKVLYIPDQYLKHLVWAPVTLLADMASVVENERALVVGVKADDGVEEATITKSERAIFSDDENDEEIVFPELEHGQHVKLEGIVTRGNEMSNTIGFWYNGRILTCKPKRGNIVRFKKQLFLNCYITGEITRLDKKGKPTEYRPKIIFDGLRVRSKREQLPLPFMLDNKDDE